MQELTPEEHRQILKGKLNRVQAGLKGQLTELQAARQPCGRTGLLKSADRVAKGVLIGGLIVFLLMVHIVYNAPTDDGFVIVLKQQPGIEDTFVNFKSLLDVPRIVLLLKHGSVIKGLEERKLLQWEQSTPTPHIDNKSWQSY